MKLLCENIWFIVGGLLSYYKLALLCSSGSYWSCAFGKIFGSLVYTCTAKMKWLSWICIIVSRKFNFLGYTRSCQPHTQPQSFWKTFSVGVNFLRRRVLWWLKSTKQWSRKNQGSTRAREQKKKMKKRLYEVDCVLFRSARRLALFFK